MSVVIPGSPRCGRFMNVGDTMKRVSRFARPWLVGLAVVVGVLALPSLAGASVAQEEQAGSRAARRVGKRRAALRRGERERLRSHWRVRDGADVRFAARPRGDEQHDVDHDGRQQRAADARSDGPSLRRLRGRPPSCRLRRHDGRGQRDGNDGRRNDGRRRPAGAYGTYGSMMGGYDAPQPARATKTSTGRPRRRWSG